ncbi:MAG: hypothetical protein KA242_05465 [Chitinophagales bacterium]|jgi:hypothetical protein|nr:hypothetical protein [Chitinophagales bacterium]
MKEEKIDGLIQLIQALSPNEKRYVRISILDNSKGKNFEILYNYLESQTTKRTDIDIPNSIKAKMNVSYEKNYLKKMILRALRNFNEDLTDNLTALQTLIDLEILFNKKLYDACLQVIEKMLKFTTEKELLNSTILYLQWYRRILLRKGDYTLLAQKADYLKDEANFCFRQLENLNGYRDIQSSILGVISKKGILLAKEDMDTLEEIIKNPLLENESKAITFHSKCHFYEAWVWYYSHTHKPEKSQLTSEAYVNFLESNKTKILQYPQVYFSAVTNFVTRCCSIDQYDKALLGIEKLETIPTLKGAKVSEGLKTEIKFFAIERKLLIYIQKRNFDKAVQFYEETNPFIEKNKGNVHVSFLSIYRIFTAIAYFHQNQLEATLTQIRNIFDDKNDSQRFDNYLYAHLLQIMTHVEMKNYRIVPYQIQAAKRFCKAKKFKQKSITLFFELVSKWIKAENNEELNIVKQSYLEKFSQLQINEGGDVVQNTLAFDLWLTPKK